MSGLTSSPRLVKGAIVGVDIFNPLASVVVFQYNPETLTRSLQPQGAGESGSARAEPLRLGGPPVETLRLEVDIDATDQLERGELDALTDDDFAPHLKYTARYCGMHWLLPFVVHRAHRLSTDELAQRAAAYRDRLHALLAP